MLSEKLRYVTYFINMYSRMHFWLLVELPVVPVDFEALKGILSPAVFLTYNTQDHDPHGLSSV